MGLPLHFWSEDVFRTIGDDLGIYLDHEISYTESTNMAIARILIHQDTRDGLVESLNLQY